MYNLENLPNTRNEAAFNRFAAPEDGALSVAAIRSWLIAEIAELSSVDVRDLAVDKPMANFGLSSMSGVFLVANVEEWLGIQLDPEVAWEYPTIDSLASYLAEQVKSQKLRS